MKGRAPNLALIARLKAIRKWLILDQFMLIKRSRDPDVHKDWPIAGLRCRGWHRFRPVLK